MRQLQRKVNANARDRRRLYVLACRYCGGELLADGEGGWSCPVRDTHPERVAVQESARRRAESLAVALRRIAHVAAGHHSDQPSHVLLHSLTVDIPEMVRLALE